MPSERRSGVTAAEVAAERERQIRRDPEYRRQVERVEAEHVEQVRRMRIAEQPVLDDLGEVGIEVDSVSRLHAVPELRALAVPVLLKHLVRDYPDPVLGAIADGLSVKAARPWWSEMSALYRQTDSDVVRDRVAVALAECATRENYEELLGFVADDALGGTRIYFLRPINRIGNRMSPGRGRSVIAALADDPELAAEATAILKGRGSND